VSRCDLLGQRLKSRDTTMCTNTKLALCVAAVLGSASAAQTAPQHSTVHQTGSTIQYQLPRSASGDDRFAPAPGQSTRANAVYFDPSPAPFNAFTYCASVLLTPSTSKRSAQHLMYRCRSSHRSEARRCRSTPSKFRKSPRFRSAHRQNRLRRTLRLNPSLIIGRGGDHLTCAATTSSLARARASGAK